MQEKKSLKGADWIGWRKNGLRLPSALNIKKYARPRGGPNALEGRQGTVELEKFVLGMGRSVWSLPKPPSERERGLPKQRATGRVRKKKGEKLDVSAVKETPGAEVALK